MTTRSGIASHRAVRHFWGYPPIDGAPAAAPGDDIENALEQVALKAYSVGSAGIWSRISLDGPSTNPRSLPAEAISPVEQDRTSLNQADP
jgi:hypothetical protein